MFRRSSGLGCLSVLFLPFLPLLMISWFLEGAGYKHGRRR